MFGAREEEGAQVAGGRHAIMSNYSDLVGMGAAQAGLRSSWALLREKKEQIEFAVGLDVGCRRRKEMGSSKLDCHCRAPFLP